MDKLTLSWRIGMESYTSDEAFGGLSEFLKKNGQVIDEIALFESRTHRLYIPLEELAETARSAARRIPQIKALGIPSVGINVITTLGHGDEAWEHLPPMPFDPMVGDDGSPARSCPCPLTKAFRDYIKDKYRLFAEAGPDFIWVDDDVRMNNHGVSHACFCDLCLERFGHKIGKAISRQEIASAFDDPEEGNLRAAWVDNNAEVLAELLADIENVVNGVDSEIQMGFMVTDPTFLAYNGSTFDKWFAALKGTKSRPGGGVYDDGAPNAVYAKTISVGRQRWLTPDNIKDVQYELENFPYPPLGKSANSTVNESTMALSVGLNGVAFNALGHMIHNNPQDYQAMADRIKDARPFWEEYVGHCDGLPTSGLWAAWNPEMMKNQQVLEDEHWLHNNVAGTTMQSVPLGLLGLPMGVDRPGDVVVLSGRIVECFSDAELEGFFSGGVYMDTPALAALAKRGLGELTGVKLGTRHASGVREQFTDDDLNGEYAGAKRDVRTEFFGDALGKCDALEAAGEGVRFLSNLTTYDGVNLGPCMSAFENAAGGRVVVNGYTQWQFLGFPQKRAQLQNVADWLAADKMPVRIETFCRVVPMVRLNVDRSRAGVVLYNMGFDPVSELTIDMRMDVTSATLLRIGAAPERLAVQGERITISRVAPWEIIALLID